MKNDGPVDRLVEEAQRALAKGDIEGAQRCITEIESVKARQVYSLYDLAEDIHKIDCHSNHTDMCGWYYEDDDYRWTRDVHKRYLDKATLMVSLLPDIALYDMARVFKAIRQ